LATWDRIALNIYPRTGFGLSDTPQNQIDNHLRQYYYCNIYPRIGIGELNLPQDLIFEDLG
jgi:hypothetical protein